MESDILVSCPYNPAHRIARYKLHTHIIKCKKSSNNAKNKVECPLDKNHIVDCDHLREHIASCPKKGKLLEIDTGFVKPKDEEPSIMIDSYNSTENWDEDPEVPTYNPMEVSANRPVIRPVSGLTKSQRRQYRENERMRIANLKGVHSTSVASSSMMRETSMREPQEIPLRPPRNFPSPIRDLQNDFNKSMQVHNDDNDDNERDTTTQASFVPELPNNSFHTLYNAPDLAPEDDNIKQMKQSLQDTEMNLTNPFRKQRKSVIDYIQHVSKEKANNSMFDQSRETKVNKTEVDTISEPFNVDNRKKERNECIASGSSVSGEQVTDRLLTLLKNEVSGIKQGQSIQETVKVNEIDKDSGEKGQTWNEIWDAFNKQLMHLTNIQTAAAEESARLIEQMKEFKLREEMAKK
ncbi:uncharacterized protein LOC105205418 isoform X1 [Solenopsis invicta]|uniref:uncharacterized protein LOC105205418 isoform X1 n=1 Tax=Solenopsis invicta TaxID=13686 RepID=UPI00193DAFF9|nr:uncharacterized protein LOC105205418 isoform X1 [Solenopsis invicta]